MRTMRTFALLLMTLAIVAGCARGAREQRVSEAPPYTPTVVTVPAPAVAVAPIPGHPPVDTTGIVKSYDPATGVITFQDGRVMKLTEQSQVLKPTETATVRPGELVIVRNVLPVAIQSASAAGKRQKMGTVASVDAANQTVRLTDGTSLTVKPTTRMHMGAAGPAVVLAELRPGDELVIVMTDAAPTASDTSTTGSALPRQVAAPAPADDAVEVMVFREAQAP